MCTRAMSWQPSIARVSALPKKRALLAATVQTEIIQRVPPCRVARQGQTWIWLWHSVPFPWQAGFLARGSRHKSSQLASCKPVTEGVPPESLVIRSGHSQRRVRGGFSPPSLTPAAMVRPNQEGKVNKKLRPLGLLGVHCWFGFENAQLIAAMIQRSMSRSMSGWSLWVAG